MAEVIHSISHGDVIWHDHHNQPLQIADEESQSKNITSLLWPDSFWGVVHPFPIIVFAFLCQVNVCDIFK